MCQDLKVSDFKSHIKPPRRVLLSAFRNEEAELCHDSTPKGSKVLALVTLFPVSPALGDLCKIIDSTQRRGLQTLCSNLSFSLLLLCNDRKT